MHGGLECLITVIMITVDIPSLLSNNVRFLTVHQVLHFKSQVPPKHLHWVWCSYVIGFLPQQVLQWDQVESGTLGIEWHQFQRKIKSYISFYYNMPRAQPEGEDRICWRFYQLIVWFCFIDHFYTWHIHTVCTTTCWEITLSDIRMNGVVLQ